MPTASSHVGEAGATGQGLRAGVLALGLCVVAGGGVRLFQQAGASGAVDFYMAWAAVTLRQEGAALAEVYDPTRSPEFNRVLQERARGSPSARWQKVAAVRDDLDNSGTPLLYAVLSPLVGPDYDDSLDRYRAVLMVAGAAGVLAWGTLAGLDVLAALLVLLALLEWSGPLRVDVVVGNVASLQLLGGAVVAGLRRRASPLIHDGLAGLVLALLVLFKPTNAAAVAVLPVAHALVRGELRSVTRLALGGVAGTLLGVLVGAAWGGGLGAWAAWAGRLPSWWGITRSLELGNFSPAVAAESVLGVSLGAPIAGLLLVAVGARLWRARAVPGRMAGSQADLALLALGWLVPLLTSRLVWFHYLVLATPALLFLLARAHRAGSGLVALATSLVLLHLPLQLFLTDITLLVIATLAANALLAAALLSAVAPPPSVTARTAAAPPDTP
ncbi:MAG: hypothetical protein HY904_04610 [Deltaproteobacteria bacterium]|nr:hypothetical protein [Deltaproteobacteria bacterium]